MSTQTNTNGNWLTVVYKDIQPGDEAEALIGHAKMSAASWSHALQDRDAAIEQAFAAPTVQPVAICPQTIIHAITEYGDARADQDANNAPTTSHERLADCIRLIRDALPPPAAPVQKTVWEMFAAYLIDKCEGEIITEEGLQRSLADMLADPNYTTLPAAQPAGRPTTSHRCAGCDLVNGCPEFCKCNVAQPAPVPLTEDEMWGLLGQHPKLPEYTRAVEARYGITKGGAA